MSEFVLLPWAGKLIRKDAIVSAEVVKTDTWSYGIKLNTMEDGELKSTTYPFRHKHTAVHMLEDLHERLNL